jgi:hypothetical protein
MALRWTSAGQDLSSDTLIKDASIAMLNQRRSLMLEVSAPRVLVESGLVTLRACEEGRWG